MDKKKREFSHENAATLQNSNVTVGFGPHHLLQ